MTNIITNRQNHHRTAIMLTFFMTLGLMIFCVDLISAQTNTGGGSQPLDLSALNGSADTSSGTSNSVPANNPAPASDTKPVPAGSELPVGSKTVPSPTPDTSVPKSSSAQKTDLEDTSKNPSLDPSVTPQGSKFWQLVKAGGFIGVILLFLSLIACAIVIQFCLTLRRNNLYPLTFAEEVKRLIDQGKYRFAHQLCGNSETLLGQILYKGLSEYQGNWAPVEKALEDSVAEESASLYRRSELLSVIGNIAPMLGLLGTVIGMVVAFGELAASDGLGKNLAQGIYFALVTTVDGLIVAIPSLVAYSLINNTIASRITELTELIDQITRPIKWAPGSTGSSAPASPAYSPQTKTSASVTPPLPPGR